jgi:hypothetical protein
LKDALAYLRQREHLGLGGMAVPAALSLDLFCTNIASLTDPF